MSWGCCHGHNQNGKVWKYWKKFLFCSIMLSRSENMTKIVLPCFCHWRNFSSNCLNMYRWQIFSRNSIMVFDFHAKLSWLWPLNIDWKYDGRFWIDFCTNGFIAKDQMTFTPENIHKTKYQKVYSCLMNSWIIHCLTNVCKNPLRNKKDIQILQKKVWQYMYGVSSFVYDGDYISLPTLHRHLAELSFNPPGLIHLQNLALASPDFDFWKLNTCIFREKNLENNSRYRCSKYKGLPG